MTEVRRSTVGKPDELGSRQGEFEVMMMLVTHWLCTSTLKHSSPCGTCSYYA